MHVTLLFHPQAPQSGLFSSKFEWQNFAVLCYNKAVDNIINKGRSSSSTSMPCKRHIIWSAHHMPSHLRVIADSLSHLNCLVFQSHCPDTSPNPMPISPLVLFSPVFPVPCPSLCVESWRCSWLNSSSVADHHLHTWFWFGNLQEYKNPCSSPIHCPCFSSHYWSKTVWQSSHSALVVKLSISHYLSMSHQCFC